jgi:hypothetical protein
MNNIQTGSYGNERDLVSRKIADWPTVYVMKVHIMGSNVNLSKGPRR